MVEASWHAAARFILLTGTFWFTARLLLTLLFGRILHGKLHIGRVGWFSLNNIEWHVTKHTKVTTSTRIQTVHIDRLGLVLRNKGAKDGDGRGVGWIGLAVTGVRIEAALVPCRQGPETDGEIDLKNGTARNPASAAEMEVKPRTDIKDAATGTAGATAGLQKLIWSFLAAVTVIHDLRRDLRRSIVASLPTKYRKRIARDLRVIRHSFISPVLTQINRIARSCNFVSHFIAVEISDITLSIPRSKARVSCGLLRFGVDLMRGKDSFIGAWLRLERISVAVMDQINPKGQEIRQADARTAIALPGPLILEGKAVFDPAIGMAALYHRNSSGKIEPRKCILDLAIVFISPAASPKTKGPIPASIHVNVKHLVELELCVKNSMQPQPRPHLGPHLGPHLHSRESSEAGDTDSLDEMACAVEPISARQNPLALLRSFRLEIPLIVAEMEVSKIGKMENAYFVDTSLQGVAVELEVGGTVQSTDKHVGWFGRNAVLKGTVRLGFEKLETNVKTLASRASSGKASAKNYRILDVSATGAHISSSWLPPRLDALFSPTKPHEDPHAVGHLNERSYCDDMVDSRIVVEGDLGGVSGESSIDMVNDVVHYIGATASTTRQATSSTHEIVDSPHARILYEDHPRLHYLPAVCLGLELGKSGFRLFGPSLPHKTAFGPGEDDAGNSTPWQASSVLCFNLPSASAHLITDIVDIAFHRSPSQLRDWNELLRRGRVSCPEVLLPYLPETFQRSVTAKTRRKHSVSYGKKDSSILGSEAVSESVSPRDSPGPRERQSQNQLVDDSGFISPTSRTADIGHSAPILISSNAPYTFSYRIRATFDVERFEVYLLSASQAGSSSVPSRSARTDSNAMDERSDVKRASHTRSTSKSTVQIKHDILSVGTSTAAVKLDLTGQALHSLDHPGKNAHLSHVEFDQRQGSVMLQVQSVETDLSKMNVFHAMNGLITTVINARSVTKSSTPRHPATEEAKEQDHRTAIKPLAEFLPPDIFFVLSINAIEVHIAGPDPKYNPEVCRGLALHTASIVFEAWRQSRVMPGQFSSHQRASLGLKDDIRARANAQTTSMPDVPQTFLRIFSAETAINPLKDAQNRSRDMRSRSSRNSSTTRNTEAHNTTWDLRNRARLSDNSTEGDARQPTGRAGNDLFWMPSLTFRFCLWSSKLAKPPTSDENGHPSLTESLLDNIGLAITIPNIACHLEIFQIYCFLLAFSALRSLKPRYSIPPSSASEHPRSRPHRPKPCVIVHADFPILESYITLPHDVRLFARFCRVKLDNAEKAAVNLRFESATIAGASIASPGLWDDLIRLREVFVAVRDEPGCNEGFQNKAFSISAAGGRLRLPFKYPFSIIIENTATFIKSIKQLSHQFLKGKYNLVIEPSPEAPKRLPRIKVSLRILVLEAADDPFETKLNLIWRAGVEEQSQRLGREQAFEDKLQSLRNADSQKSEDERLSQDNAPRSRAKSTLKPADAYAVLQSIHSTKWIKRHRNAVSTRKRREENQLRRLYGSIGHTTGISAFRDSSLPIQLVTVTGTAPLLRWAMENTVVEISKPSFGDSTDGLASFLENVGKGMPRDTQYTLIVPFHLNWQMSEARIHLRDYPLPLIYIPPVQQPHSEAKSWQLSTDFVIAEEVGPSNSIRYVPATIVPRELAGSQQNLPYVLRVPRTAMPIKTYALPEINITSTWATRIGWGNSIQPTIQDVMRVMDSLTKAPPDPSERMGFWDKLRLILHWRIAINFLGEGPLNFILKGSRNPYSLQGPGAGFALCWSGNVRWTMGFPNDEREFFQIRSDTFLLGVPDLKDYVDAAATGVIRENTAYADSEERSQASGAWSESANLRAYRRDQTFEKICAKFLGGVKWGLGLQMERTCTPETCIQRDHCTGRTFDRQCRFFTFNPHYDVKTIAGADHPYEKNHDSYAGFRSDFLHFSISVIANEPDSPAKSIHLTPIGFTHFWAWWHLFDGTMSLPVRHGALFPTTQAPSKKFGKHCATIKYKAQLSPVYIAHTYRQETAEAWHRGFTTVLGLKGRIGTFNVDLHQREQEESVYSEGLRTTRTRLHKAFFRAEVDCIDTDMRVISSRFTDLHKPLVRAHVDSDDDEDGEHPIDMDSAPPIADEDLPWVDLDDFYDLYVCMPDLNPKLRIVPCFKSPRLTYSRYSQASNPDSTDDMDHRKAESKFGNEGTHKCLLDQATDAVEVQLNAMQSRIHDLQHEIRQKSRSSTRHTVQELDELQAQLAGALRGAERLKAYQSRRHSTRPTVDRPDAPGRLAETDEIQDFQVFDDLDLWINRLIVHNPNMVVTQNIRDILLRYYYSSMNRRLFEYALSTRALKFIRELDTGHSMDDSKAKARRTRTRRPQAQRSTSEHAREHETHTDLLEKMLNDEGVNWSFTEPAKAAAADRVTPDSASQSSESSYGLDPHHEAANDLADHWGVRNSFVISLLKPQVALESDATESATVIVTANSMQFRIFNIVDEQHVDDPINSQVMHRSFASIDALQAFYPHVKGWRSGQREKALSSLRFVPLEVLAGCADDPRHLDRIVPRTSARLRYDKHNRLRLLNDSKKKAAAGHSSKSSNLDRMVVLCDRFSVSATPKHYTAIYNVVTSLILHTDPGQKARNQKIERVALSKDFSDRLDIAMTVSRQQDEIRAIRSQIMALVALGSNHLSESAVMDLYLLSADFLRRMELISMWMGAIQRSQDSKNSSKSMGMQLDARASEIVWHMRDSEETPLVKVAVKGVAFRWLNRSDGSVANCLLISDLLALNSSPEQYFSEIIAKQPAQATANGVIGRQEIFVAILWSMLSPVGGINVIERFEVHLHPIRLQLEQRVGKHIMSYLFAQREARKKHAEEDSGRSDNSSNSKTSAGPVIRRQASSNVLRSTKSTESLLPTRKSLEVPTSKVGQRLSVPSSSASSVTGASSMQTRPVSLRRVSSSETLALGSGKTDDYLDAEEMRERARVNRAFHHVEVFPTIITISFKGEKHTSLPDLYGLVYKSPTIIHCNRIWTYLDLLENIKRDFKSSIWSQSATLIGQLLTTARKPKNVVQHHVQHRLLGLSDRDKSEDRKQKRSFSSSIRARMTSGNGDSHKASPLRASLMRASSGQADEDSDSEDGNLQYGDRAISDDGISRGSQEYHVGNRDQDQESFDFSSESGFSSQISASPRKPNLRKIPSRAST